MATTLNKIGQVDPLFAASIKNYDETEVADLIRYIDATILWMQELGIHDVGEDVVMFRVGIPYCGSDSAVDASTVYTSDDSIDRLITTLSVDAIKFTAYTPDGTLPDIYQMKSDGR